MAICPIIYARAGVDTDVINHATKYTNLEVLKWKQNFSTVTKLSLMNLYLNQKH